MLLAPTAMNEFTTPPDRKVTYKALNSEAVAAARAAAGAAGLTTEDWLSRVILENAQANGIITADPGFGMRVAGGAAEATAHLEPGASAVNGHGGQNGQNGQNGHGGAGGTGSTGGPAQNPKVVSGLAAHIHQAKQAAQLAGLPVEAWLNRAIIDSARAQTVVGNYEEIIGADSAEEREPVTWPAPVLQPVTRPVTQPVMQPVMQPVTQPAQQAAVATGATPLGASGGVQGAADGEVSSADPYQDPNQDPSQETYQDIRRQPAEAEAAPSIVRQPEAGIGSGGAGYRNGRDRSIAAAASDPLQERLARIVAARREEQARFDHPDDPPMILASRPGEAGKKRAAPRHLADFDEVDRQSHSGSLSWFWMTMMIILAALAAIIWALPFLSEPVRSGGQATIRPLTAVAIPPIKPQTRPVVTPTPQRNGALPTPVREHFAVWRKAAEAGNHQAQIVVARRLITGGHGIPRDPAAAVKLLRDAADRGNNPEAQFLLAYLLERGTGVKEKNFVDATLYYQKAAAQGYMPAVTEVGIAFLHGIGVKRDYQKAFRYLERAAEAGQAKAQFRLGFAYERGMGVPKNRVLALKWYILAAERQHSAATARLEDTSYKTKKEERDKAAELAREFNRRYRDTSKTKASD